MTTENKKDAVEALDVSASSAIPCATADETAHGWKISGSVISALCEEVNIHRDRTLGLDDETAELVVLTLAKMGYVRLSPNTKITDAEATP